MKRTRDLPLRIAQGTDIRLNNKPLMRRRNHNNSEHKFNLVRSILTYVRKPLSFSLLLKNIQAQYAPYKNFRVLQLEETTYRGRYNSKTYLKKSKTLWTNLDQKRSVLLMSTIGHLFQSFVFSRRVTRHLLCQRTRAKTYTYLSDSTSTETSVSLVCF